MELHNWEMKFGSRDPARTLAKGESDSWRLWEEILSMTSGGRDIHLDIAQTNVPFSYHCAKKRFEFIQALYTAK